MGSEVHGPVRRAHQPDAHLTEIELRKLPRHPLEALTESMRTQKLRIGPPARAGRCGFNDLGEYRIAAARTRRVLVDAAPCPPRRECVRRPTLIRPVDGGSWGSRDSPAGVSGARAADDYRSIPSGRAGGGTIGRGRRAPRGLRGGISGGTSHSGNGASSSGQGQNRTADTRIFSRRVHRHLIGTINQY